MAKKMFDAEELLKALNGNADPESVKALIQEAENAVAEEKAAKVRKEALDKVWNNVKGWLGKHIIPVELPNEVVTTAKIKFNLNAETRRFEYDYFTVGYENRASAEMIKLVSALDAENQEDGDFGEYYESILNAAGISEQRVENIILQSAFDDTGRKTISDKCKSQYSMHFTAGAEITDDKGSITIELKGFQTVEEEDEEGNKVVRKLAQWEVEKPVLGTTRKSSNGSKATVPGYSTNREYLMEIADDKVRDLLKEHNGDWTKINASQHIIRIEKTFADDSKRLYHKAKGL